MEIFIKNHRDLKGVSSGSFHCVFTMINSLVVIEFSTFTVKNAHTGPAGSWRRCFIDILPENYIKLPDLAARSAIKLYYKVWRLSDPDIIKLINSGRY